MIRKVGDGTVTLPADGNQLVKMVLIQYFAFFLLTNII